MMYERIRLFFNVSNILFVIKYSVNDLAYKEIRRYSIDFIHHHKKAVQYLLRVTIYNIRAESAYCFLFAGLLRVLCDSVIKCNHLRKTCLNILQHFKSPNIMF